MPQEHTQTKLVKSNSDVLVHKKLSTGSYSSASSSNSFFVPEVEFLSASGNDSGVDSPRNCENQPLLGKMQCEMLMNAFPGQ